MHVRPRVAVAAPVAVALAAGAAAFALAEQVVTPRRARLGHEVLAASAVEVTLAADEDTLREGRLGIYWRSGHAVVGPPIAVSARAVTRSLERVDEGRVRPGKVGIGHLAVGDPWRALRLGYNEVTPSSDVGALPCWEVPGRGDTWVLLVHGYGGTRASALDFLEVVRRFELPAMALSYRNDEGAPPSPDARYHLGDSEWRDVEAAMEHAVASGAERLVLMGWSMGGAIVLQSLLRARHRRRVAGVVLDCPVLDWRGVLAEQGSRRNIPAPLVALASRLVEHRIGIDFDAFEWTSPGAAARLERPALVLHGADDPVVPVAASRAFAAAAAPGLVDLDVTPGAGHVGSLYADPLRYEAALGRFLARLGVLDTSSGLVQ